MSSILIIILSIVALIFFHELGHFLFAKKYGVRVEEFGIGIPPRIFGKKIGETIYSLNLIPLGGFVKLFGEDVKANDERSFSSKPIYQRAVILFAGVAAFFVIAFLIFSVYSVVGIRVPVAEEELEMYPNSEVFIIEVIKESPAAGVGIVPGDVLLEIDEEKIIKPSQAVLLLEEKKGEEINVKILRGQEELLFSLVPRVEYTEKEGSLGLAMVITASKKYPVYYAPVKGAIMTGETTYSILSSMYNVIASSILGKELPSGMRVGGPVAIVQFGSGAVSRGFSDFLQFLGLITVSLAVLNILPIPALDGGRLMFLLIEKIKGSPISEKLEYGLNAGFFILLMGVLIAVTYSDIALLIGNKV
jgi:regulator of sigma E protease